MSHTESSSRIHVLGLGSIGTFTAHGLSEIPSRPSVTLLLHRESLLGGYQENGNQILLTTREGFQIGYSGYDLEVHRTNGWYPEPSSPSSEAINSSISHLIISVKATQTVSALQPLKHRLDAKSTILFLQNGSGMIDEVNESLFPDPQTRPNYIIGVISHGVTLNRPFDVTHTGFAAMSLGLVPRSEEAPQPQEFSSSYLLDNLPLSPRLNATSYPYTKVLQIQLEKLAVNAFCNPLCALNDAKNGFLFTLPDTRREILTEISNVVLALPELRDVPGVEERFAVDRLEATVNAILTKTAETTCSMVWDLRAGRETEVRFINGYWVKRGGEVGVRTPVNEYLVEKVTKRSRRELK
ncbi:ketopantoate reductase PanE/ApbA C terminal-domain-containing protein [Aspergillus pseudocaelatus]|uniref:2-dehydropantoate 2-reductase n=1 Tax=Aspergillus pseudocaelatus TaxID=1825620 RepID=A0ABQ6W1A7_9EURO|nr:ketopantoate reductase PanE/ApbA C terminal-domain-containing protein [Aspergillus pseudocaelatus]